MKTWQVFLDALDDRGVLDWDEVCFVASFSSTTNDATGSATKQGKGHTVAGGS